jgi:uncharacterized Zn-finger protein
MTHALQWTPRCAKRVPIRIAGFAEIVMAGHSIPHFHNSDGHRAIEIGVREFMCVGARPPQDHPHVFLDMGAESEMVCPYCSTLYRHDPGLAAEETRPSGCTFDQNAA